MPKTTIVMLPQDYPPPSDSLARSHERMLAQVNELLSAREGAVVFVSRPAFMSGAHDLLRRMADSRTMFERKGELSERFQGWLDHKVAPCLQAVRPNSDQALAFARVPMLSAKVMETVIARIVELYHSDLAQRLGCGAGPWTWLHPQKGEQRWSVAGALFVESLAQRHDDRILVSASTLEHVPGSAAEGERDYTLLPWYDHSVLGMVAYAFADGGAEVVFCRYGGSLADVGIHQVLPLEMRVSDHVLQP